MVLCNSELNDLNVQKVHTHVTFAAIDHRCTFYTPLHSPNIYSQFKSLPPNRLGLSSHKKLKGNVENDFF